ncbi:MAG: hypothetical protein HYS40_03025 [Gemmatimonadetes bacterium]|nr:hypothetical protein [Gemmatimonadota bacterium]
MARPLMTAEWICTHCGATNRKLVPEGVSRATDECYTCHAKHEIEAEARPVRWKSRPKG